MTAASSSSPLEKGTIPKAITSTMPLGMIFYPTETTEIDETEYDKEKIKQLTIEILETLKDGMSELGLKIFEKMKIPPWFTIEEVCSKWSTVVNRIFDDSIKKMKENQDLTHEDKLLLEQLKLNRGIEIAINHNKKSVLKTFIQKYRNQINESFDIIESTLYAIRRRYSQIFLESKLNPKFMTYISKTINVTISYFHYLKSELNKIISELRHILSGRGSIDHFKKGTKAALTRITSLDIKQFELLLKILELDIFMDMWSSEAIDELFEPKKVYNNKKLDNEFFLEILNDLNKISMELHFELIKISRDRKKDVPFTFSKNFDTKNKEKMELISRIIHNS